MCLEKRALSIIISGEDDQTAIKKLGMIHHEHWCEKFFQAAKYELRKNRTFEVPLTRTNRLKNTFMFARGYAIHSIVIILILALQCNNNFNINSKA